MLILTRRPRESIYLLKDGVIIANIKLLENEKNRAQAKIGVEADDDIVVLRKEVYERKQLEKDLYDEN